ncbi:MAG: nucleotidyltransferase [Cyphobasidiales sp. Tagirdzhanova-0007]|nr:MAG: nucleotidyltransferase [Cyphobasidiales sp. Tagirdzhanova-0007]
MAPCALCDPHTPRRAILRRPKTAQAVCRECFFLVFETEIHNTIIRAKLFTKGQKVGIAASGGKDSTVLAHILTLLNERYDYGLELQLLSIDEGISGYRDDSLLTVQRNSEQYQLPLKILSYSDLYDGWTMDKVVKETGKKGNCTYCGVFRRKALDLGGDVLEVDHIVTGHNADDVAETIFMNVLRGDIARLERCTAITTGTGEKGQAVKRSKPFKYAYEKEIVMYAYFKKLDYHSTECIYSPTAYRGHARALIKDLEAMRASSILDIIYSGEAMAGMVKSEVKRPTQRQCERCGSMASQALCQACALLDTLNKGAAKLHLDAVPNGDG